MEVARFGCFFLKTWQNTTIPWTGKDVAGLCLSGFLHFRWQHLDMSEHDTTVPLCNSLSQQRRWIQGNSRCSSTGGWWPQLPPQDLSLYICQSQGFDYSKAQDTFLLLARICPMAESKASLPCSSPWWPTDAPRCFLSLQFSSPKTKLCPRAPVSATRARHICALQHISPLLWLCREATKLPEKGWLCATSSTAKTPKLSGPCQASDFMPAV